MFSSEYPLSRLEIHNQNTQYYNPSILYIYQIVSLSVDVYQSYEYGLGDARLENGLPRKIVW